MWAKWKSIKEILMWKSLKKIMTAIITILYNCRILLLKLLKLDISMRNVARKLPCIWVYNEFNLLLIFIFLKTIADRYSNLWINSWSIFKSVNIISKSRLTYFLWVTRTLKPLNWLSGVIHASTGMRFRNRNWEERQNKDCNTPMYNG